MIILHRFYFKKKGILQYFPAFYNQIQITPEFVKFKFYRFYQVLPTIRVIKKSTKNK